MTPRHLIARALAFYWRSNLAVIAGVGTAVAVLAWTFAEWIAKVQQAFPQDIRERWTAAVSVPEALP